MDGAALVRRCLQASGATKRDFAARVGTSRAALHAIASGRRTPGLDLAVRIARAGGFELGLSPSKVAGRPAASLAQHAAHVDPHDPIWSWRWLSGDLVANEFVPASANERADMLAARPDPVGDPRWDAFLAALAEHLAGRARLPLPSWVDPSPVDHESFWWPVHGGLPSTRVAAMAHSPAAFSRRGILIDGRDLPRVTP